MIFRTCIFASLCLAGSAIAQFGQFSEPQLTPQENAVEDLLSERESTEAMEKAVEKARELGVADQVILEARFLFHVDRAEDAEIADMLPKFREQKKKFVLAESEIFASEDDWLAVTEYVEALAALERGEKENFKKHIQEAFWLSPRQGAAFAPHIDRIRLMDAMSSIKIDFGRTYRDVLSGDKRELAKLVEGKKGSVLHFWSPWSRECEATMPDFFATAEHLGEVGISVISFLPETSAKVIEDAKKMLSEKEKEIPGSWLVDTKKSPISNKLKIQTVPAVVVVAKDGSILFNGHPTDGDFWKALLRISENVKRPQLTD